MLNTMYYAWVKHGILPSKTYKMSTGELEILNAFHLIELENRHPII